MAAPEQLATKEELEARIQKELFGDFTYALVGCVAAIPLSRHVPYKFRFTPLLVLGAVGSLIDFTQGEKRAEPFRRRLEEIKARDDAGGSSSSSSLQ
jgi:hypothetical protein